MSTPADVDFLDFLQPAKSLSDHTVILDGIFWYENQMRYLGRPFRYLSSLFNRLQLFLDGQLISLLNSLMAN